MHVMFKVLGLMPSTENQQQFKIFGLFFLPLTIDSAVYVEVHTILHFESQKVAKKEAELDPGGRGQNPGRGACCNPNRKEFFSLLRKSSHVQKLILKAKASDQQNQGQE